MAVQALSVTPFFFTSCKLAYTFDTGTRFSTCVLNMF